MQKGFIFDVNKCTGCEACQVACRIENGVTPDISWRRVYTFNEIHYPGLPHFSHSLACNHCEDPPCMAHCPAAAYTKDAATGAVVIDAGACIGCGYCSWVCPFDAPRLNHSTGKVEKCTFCSHRLEEGLEPACSALCPTGALKFGDHHGGKDEVIILGFTPSAVRPAVAFVPLRKRHEQPVCTAAPDDLPALDDLEPVSFREEPRITLRSEWPLVGFTILFAALAAWTAASVMTDAAPGRAAFAVTGAAVMILGALHLGSRTRAYRSILNWRTSWLSREVILVFTFLAAAGAYALFVPGNAVVGGLAALAGFTALFAVDRVYDAAGTGGFRAHSARVFLTGFYFLGILSGNSVVFGIFLAVRSFLYWSRKSRAAKSGGEARPMLSLARIVLGFVIPVALWSGAPGLPPLTVIVGVIAGELIDRCELYLELDFPSPSKQMARDLAAVLHSRKNRNEVT